MLKGNNRMIPWRTNKYQDNKEQQPCDTMDVL